MKINVHTYTQNIKTFIFVFLIFQILRITLCILIQLFQSFMHFSYPVAKQQEKNQRILSIFHLNIV